MPKHVSGALARPNKKISEAGSRAPAEPAVATRGLADATIKVHVNRLLAAAPPLTADQRDRLALLLRGAS